MSEIPPISVQIQADIASLKTGLDQAQSDIKRFGETVQRQTAPMEHFKSTFAGMFMANLAQQGLAVVTNALHDAWSSAAEYQVVLAKTNAVIKSTGDVAGISAEGLRKQADSLESLSGVDKATIQNSENLLATFTNIRNVVGKNNDVFNQATKVTLDMSKALGQDLSSASIMVGKALNDPVKGMTALRRVGVSLSDQQQALVKHLVATGDTMGAQKVILAELNREFGGAAKAAGGTLSGQISKLKNSFDDLTLLVINAATPAITGIVKVFTGAITWLTQNKDVLLLIGAAISAVLIPATVLYTKKLAEQAIEMAAANWQITLVVGAIVLLVAGFVKAWNASDTFRQVMITVGQAVLTVIQVLVNAVINLGQKIYEGLVGPLKGILEIAAKIPSPFQSAAKSALSFVDGVDNAFNSASKSSNDFFDSVKSKMDGLKNSKISLDMSALTGASDLGGGGGGGSAPGGGGGSGGGGGKGKAAPKPQDNAILAYIDQTQTKIAAAVDKYNRAAATAQKAHDKVVLKAQTNYQAAVDAATKTFQQDRETAEKDHQSRLLKIQTEYAKKFQSIVQQSMDLLRSAWSQGVSTNIATMFDTMQKAGDTSASGLLDGLKKRLADAQKLAQDAARLASMGFSQKFVQEVVAAGPQHGDALAQSIFGADGKTQQQLIDTYNQMTDITNHGMDSVAQTMYDKQGLANDQLKQQYAQTQADLQTAIAGETETYRQAIVAVYDKMRTTLVAAKKTMDDQIKAADDALTAALTNAAQALDDSLKSIEQSFTAKMKSMKASLQSTLEAMQQMYAQLAADKAQSSYNLSQAQTGNTGGMTPWGAAASTTAQIGASSVKATVAQSEALGQKMTEGARNAGDTYVHYELNTTAQTNASPSQIASDVMVALQNGTPLSAAHAGYLTRTL